MCDYDAITKYTNSQSPDKVFNGKEQSTKPGHCVDQPEMNKSLPFTMLKMNMFAGIDLKNNWFVLKGVLYLIRMTGFHQSVRCS